MNLRSGPVALARSRIDVALVHGSKGFGELMKAPGFEKVTRRRHGELRHFRSRDREHQVPGLQILSKPCKLDQPTSQKDRVVAFGAEPHGAAAWAQLTGAVRRGWEFKVLDSFELSVRTVQAFEVHLRGGSGVLYT